MKRKLSGVMMLVMLLGLFLVIYTRLQSFTEKDTNVQSVKAPVVESGKVTTAYPAASHEPHILFLPE